MPDEFIQSLLDQGARRTDPEDHQKFLEAAQQETLPRIRADEEAERVAARNVRTQSIVSHAVRERILDDHKRKVVLGRVRLGKIRP